MDESLNDYEKIIGDKHEYRYKISGKRICELKISDCWYYIWKG